MTGSTVEAAPPPADPTGRTTLAATDPDRTESAATVLSDDGRIAAYQSRPAATQQGSTSTFDGPWQVFRRALPDGLPQLVSSGLPAGADAIAPSISAGGDRVAYEVDYHESRAADPSTVRAPGDRQLFVGTVPISGTPADRAWQRVGECDLSTPDTDCGPRLSGDGRTVAFPATESIISPYAFHADSSGEFQPLYDFGRTDFATRVITIDIARAGVTFSRPPLTTGGAFRVVANSVVQDTTPECVGTFPAGTSCDIAIRYTSAPCGEVRTDFGTVRTVAATPAGRTALALVGTGCVAPGGGALTGSPVQPSATPPCGATPSPAPVPSTFRDGLVLDPVGPYGEVPLHTVAYRSWTVTNSDDESDATVDFSAPGCALTLDESVPDTPSSPTCRQYDSATQPAGSVLAPGQSCTAYVRFEPQDIAPYAASLTLTSGSGTRILRFSGSGSQDVVLARHDDGSGRFAGQPQLVGEGSQPSVSYDGQLIAFASRCTPGCDPSPYPARQVYVADLRTGSTQLVSLGQPAGSAAEPSLSGDGSRVAFGTRTTAGGQSISTKPDQVYVRDLRAGRTVLASARADGNPAEPGSFTPALSRDGSTVAYTSLAGDLLADPQPRYLTSTVYARDLGPDFGGPGQPGNEQVSVGAAAAGGGAIGEGSSQHPATDGDGGAIGFDSSYQLTGAPLVSFGTAAYVRTRSANLDVTPLLLAFPTTPVDATSPPLVVSVSNGGPGPARLDIAVTGPYRIVGTPCLTVHRDETCGISVVAAPTVPGGQSGTLVVNGTVVSLTGRATAPLIEVAPDRVAFPPHGLGLAGQPIAVAVRNISGLALAVTASYAPPVAGFAVAPAGCSAVPAGRCTFRTTYTPGQLAPLTASLVLHVTGDGIAFDQAVPATGTTLAPTLSTDPTVLIAGRVAAIQGDHFPPGQPVTLSWQPGIGMASATADAAGHFAVQLVTLKADVPGGRTPVATVAGSPPVTGPAVLLEPGPGQPPDFASRG